MFRCLFGARGRFAIRRRSPCRPIIEPLECRLVPSASTIAAKGTPPPVVTNSVQSTLAILQAARSPTSSPAIVFAPDAPHLAPSSPPAPVNVPPPPALSPLPIVALPIEPPPEVAPADTPIATTSSTEQARADPAPDSERTVAAGSVNHTDSAATESGELTSLSSASLPPDTSA
jgi:hypothetical protein